jgi:hypothetical protein
MLVDDEEAFTLRVTTSEVSLPHALVVIIHRNNWLLFCNEVLETVRDEVLTPEY